MDTAVLEGGFASPSTDAAHAFRAVMQAMARPGTIHRLAGATPPKGLSVAAGAVLLTLCDQDTPIHLAPGIDTADLRAWIAFHTGAPIVPAQSCRFALGPWADLLPLDRFAIGTSEFPDRSATMIVEMPGLERTGATLRGPGIKDSAALSLPELPAFRRNRALYPLGLDFLFTSGDRIAALPRSTEVS